MLNLGGLDGAGLPMLQDLARSIGWFRERARKSSSTAGLLRSASTTSRRRPTRSTSIRWATCCSTAIRYFRTYFRGTLDKLAVDVNLFKVGSHKTAPEDWTRTDMSPEDREGAKVWIGALWDSFKADVAQARELEPELIQAYADEAAAGVRSTGGDIAQYALARGLVDALKTHTEFEQIVAGVVGEDEDTRRLPFGGLAELPADRALGRAAGRRLRRQDRGRSSLRVRSWMATSFRAWSAATRSPGSCATCARTRIYAAVVLRIDSPGGSMMASEVIRREIAALREAGKPVVASMGTVAASGGYYIAMDADRIVAAPTTITGSIGVFAVVPTFQRTLGKIGITSDGFGTTELAGQAQLDRELGADAEADPAGLGRARLRHLRDPRGARARPPAGGDREPRPGPCVDRGGGARGRHRR